MTDPLKNQFIPVPQSTESNAIEWEPDSEHAPEVFNEKTDDLIVLGSNLLNHTIAEDAWFGGYDPDDFKDILLVDTAILQSLQKGTLSQAKRRYEIAQEMLIKITKTDSGWDSCVELKKCHKVEIPGPQASSNYESNKGYIKYFGKIVIEVREGYLTPKDKSPKEYYGREPREISSPKGPRDTYREPREKW